jgi:hypothetical protein
MVVNYHAIDRDVRWDPSRGEGVRKRRGHAGGEEGAKGEEGERNADDDGNDAGSESRP